VRTLGAVGRCLFRPHYRQVGLIAAIAGGVYALGADPPVKPAEPPPVIPAGESVAPAAPAVPSKPSETNPPAKPGDQPLQPSLPDNLPMLLEPDRPDLFPKRSQGRRLRPLVPMTEAEQAELEVQPTDELPPFLEMVKTVPQQDVAHYSIEDPIARTSLDNIFSSGERFYDGFGGIIRPFDVATLPRAPIEAGRGFRMGPLSLRPGISGALIGMRRGESDGRSDESSAVISAAVSGIMGAPETGRYLTLDYGIARIFQSEQAEDSDLDQSLFLAGHLEFGRLKLGLGINFANLSGFDRDAGGQLQRDYLTVALTSTLQLTPRTSIDWDIATPNGRYPGDGSTGRAVGNSTGFSSTNFVNYEYSGKSKIGLGFTAGILEVEDADRQTFERVLARVSSTPTAFLSYSATAGVEFRDTGHKDMTNPIFSLGAVWTPRERTVITLSGEQRVANSVSTENSNFVSTALVLSVSQQLGDRFRVGLSAGFENAKYESIGPGESSDRRERTYLGQLSVSAIVAKRVDVSASVSYVRTQSEDSSYTVQCALQASFLF
jgi:hypothetical protein